MKISNLFNDLKIKIKLLVLSLTAFLFLLIFIGIELYDNLADNRNSIQLLEANTRSEYDAQIKDQVQNVITLLGGVYQKYRSGEMTLDQSQKLGADLVRNLRYGEDGYFWVDTTSGENVVLLGSSTEGTNRYHYLDAKGTPIVQILIQNAVKGNPVCIDYWFPKAGQTQAVRKRGYAELFRPFGWVVGTGIYIDNIDQKIDAMNREQLDALKRKALFYAALFSAFTTFTITAVFIISKNISEPLQKSVDVAGKISDGVLDVTIHGNFKSRKDEVGQLSVSLEKMQNSIRNLVKNLTEKADALYQEEERFRTTLISVGDGVISTDASGKIVLINPIAEQLTGWAREDAVGRHIETVFRIIQERGENAEESVFHYFSEGKLSLPENNLTLISRTGKRIPIENSAAPISGKGSAVTGAVLVFRDITEQNKKSEQIRYLGYHDQMTGLYNRTYFEQQMASIDVPEKRPISVIMADINGLKLVNDAYGHLAGDKLIQKTAEVLKRECRQKDMIFRIGGDEFVVLLEKTDLSQAQSLIVRLQQEVEVQKNDGVIYLSTSFGCAQKLPITPTMEDVLRQAEDVMYREKLVKSRTTKLNIINHIKEQLFSTMEEDNEHYPEISDMCQGIGKIMNFETRDLQDLALAALLHDIGKVTVDRAIWHKPGPLTEEEWEEVRHHPEAGYHILKASSQLSQIAEYVLAHHERWDGKGYPKGLKGEEIPLPSRIIAVADTYYAMTSDRPYRKAFTQEETLEEIRRNSSTQFDPAVVDAFLHDYLQW